MRFLLSFISLIFSSIFYCFFLLSNWKNIFWEDLIVSYKLESLSSNLFYESIFFVVLSIIFFIYFWKINFSNTSNNNVDSSINRKKLIIFIKRIFKDYLYYFWFILFYISIYLIWKNYSYIDISHIILIINISIIFLFFITKKFFIFKDFIKINTILFSLIYIIFYIYILITNYNFLNYIDSINSILILIFFCISLSHTKFLTKNEEKDKTLVSYFWIYVFILISFYLNYIFLNKSFIICTTGFLFSFSIYYFLLKLHFFKDIKKTLKYLWLFSLYISSISWIFYIVKNDFSIIIYLILIYSIFFNLIFHRKNENYISLFFSFFIGVFIIFFTYFKYFNFLDNSNLIFLIIVLSISFLIILYTYFFKLKYIFAYYFYHIISYLINICWVWYYFFLIEFDILKLGIILFIESIFVFLSYYKINKI